MPEIGETTAHDPSASSTPSARTATRTPTSFVFTSSKYAAPDVTPPHNRPSLPPALLSLHSARAHNSADFGRILPGFTPLPLPPLPGTPSPPPEAAEAADPFAFLPPRMKPACPLPHARSEGTLSAGSPTRTPVPAPSSSSLPPQPKQSMSELLARGASTEKISHRGRDHGRKHSPKAKYNPDGTRRDPLVVAAHHIELKNRHADETAAAIRSPMPE